MASGFVEAIMAQAIAASDPQVKLAQQFLGTQTKVMEQDLIGTKLVTIGLISSDLAKAKADAECSPAVVDAYERLLQMALGS